MKLTANHLYHIYNQGNNKQNIFQDDNDYICFLKKIREELLPNCNILAYCLMPNHFHFLVDITEKSVEKIKLGSIEIDKVSNAFRKILSSYAGYFNQKYEKTGSLFRQKTKGKCLTLDKSHNYSLICLNYIHQNPYKANLILNSEFWKYSSYIDYLGVRNGTLCDFNLAYQYLDINKIKIEDGINLNLEDEDIKHIF
ncbi:MAG: transposase [Cytophagales bacterium]|nr:MAG: transposase [Cytophagales bacterium]